MKRLSATLALLLLASGLAGCAYDPGTYAGYGYAPRYYGPAPTPGYGYGYGYASSVNYAYAPPPPVVYAPPPRLIYPAAVAPVRIQASFGVGRGWGGHGGWGHGWGGRGGWGGGHGHWR